MAENSNNHKSNDSKNPPVCCTTTDSQNNVSTIIQPLAPVAQMNKIGTSMQDRQAIDSKQHTIIGMTNTLQGSNNSQANIKARNKPPMDPESLRIIKKQDMILSWSIGIFVGLVFTVILVWFGMMLAKSLKED